MRSAGGLDETRDVDGGVRPADQVCMAPDVATMFEDRRPWLIVTPNCMPTGHGCRRTWSRRGGELEQAHRPWWHRWLKR
jgi:hypothetical protein